MCGCRRSSGSNRIHFLLCEVALIVCAVIWCDKFPDERRAWRRSELVTETPTKNFLQRIGHLEAGKEDAKLKFLLHFVYPLIQAVG